MTVHPILSDAWWVARRQTVPRFVDKMVGNGGHTRRFMPELVKQGIHYPKDVLLYLITRSLRPHIVVETGVHHGWSSRAILSAMYENDGGHLYSVDLPNSAQWRNEDGLLDNSFVKKPADTGRAIPDYLRERWSLYLGRSQDLLPQLLDRVGPVDMFFHDSDHTERNMLWEYRTAWPRVRSRGLLYSDDINMTDSFWTAAREFGAHRYIFQLTLDGGRTGGLRKA